MTLHWAKSSSQTDYRRCRRNIPSSAAGIAIRWRTKERRIGSIRNDFDPAAQVIRDEALHDRARWSHQAIRASDDPLHDSSPTDRRPMHFSTDGAEQFAQM